ncbi:MAG: efflux RND transporter permease subunit [Immundisolibacter sp.]|uniref:efflux RND transporter permease subunit n=1 Tax=Immundisolibacter sp. TaxID=1934948 RepID=UPI0019B4B615|nr:efflux RND transporter permease subunit [Immundisolibacter sp.]MBC7162011.1 efflux RND transporter permease subunit [Immundisolibacter sp.]
MSDPRFNVAGRLASFFVDSKLTPLVILGVSLFGTLALLLTPREENPQILVPAAQVSVALPGASAQEVERLLLTPLEAALSEMPDVKHTYGTASNSLASVQVEFDVGVPKEAALVRVYDKVEQLRPRLPPQAGAPTVTPIDADDVPVVTITLASAEYDDHALKRVADRMAERLRSVRGVSIVQVYGGRDRELRVEVEPERMQAFGITLDQGLARLAASNLARPVGDITERGERAGVYLDNQLASLEDLRHLVVGESKGRLIYLEDVAEIIDGPPQDRHSMARLAFGAADPRFAALGGQELPAVTIAVAKKSGQNAVRIGQQVQERVLRMQRQFVPASVQVVTTRNDGDKADDAVNTLVEHLAVAILAVVGTLLLTLGWREGLMVMLVVPLVMLTVVMADGFAGVTINRVALFALILALGSLVDDAIVVVENIYRHYTDNPAGDRRAMAVLAVAEIGNATNFATFSMMAVFAAMIVVSGMPGEFFFPIVFNLPTAMFTSLLFAYVVTPWAARRWLRPKPLLGDFQAHSAQAYGAYDRVLCLLLDRPLARRALYVAMVGLIALSALMPAWQYLRPSGPVGEKSLLGLLMTFLPKDDVNTFNIFVDLPENASVEQTDALVREVGRELRATPEVSNYLVALAQPGVTDLSNLLRGSLNRYAPYQAEVRVNLIHRRQRARTSLDIVAELRPRLHAVSQRYPGSVIRTFDDPPGPPSRAKVLAEVYGTDQDDMRRVAADVLTQFEATAGVAEVFDSVTEPVHRHRVVVDEEKAALSGVSSRQIADVLQVLFEGVAVGRVHLPDERNVVPIRIQVPRRDELRPQDLDRIQLSNAAGQIVPLSELVHVVADREDEPILHKDNERVIFVGSEYLTGAGLYAVLGLNQRLAAVEGSQGQPLRVGNLGLYDEPPDTIRGTNMLWEGETRMMLDAYRDMTYALLLAICVVYLMLVAYYRSFAIPLVALAALPLAFIGVFPGHLIMGAEFSGASMVGIIALVGMVVRASLLIIEFGRDAEAQGMTLREAMRTACALRLRPIVLTSLTNILGATVMLLDPVFQGLAISVIFGTLFSTGLTMIVVPALYYAYRQRLLRVAAV